MGGSVLPGNAMLEGTLVDTDFALTEEARAIARGGVLFYPCAGGDLVEAVEVFAPHVRSFWFVDPNYRYRDLPEFVGYEAVGSVQVRGDEHAVPETRGSGLDSHRFVEPCVWTTSLRHKPSDVLIEVHRRRGYGEYALIREFEDRSISVFMHRGDSVGESGSNSFFLANRTRRHEPLSRLFDKLSMKLCDEALIVSDGSNCHISRLRTYHNDREASGAEAASRMAGKPFELWGFRWRCVGHMRRRYGPTLIWRISRLTKA